MTAIITRFEPATGYKPNRILARTPQGDRLQFNCPDMAEMIAHHDAARRLMQNIGDGSRLVSSPLAASQWIHVSDDAMNTHARNLRHAVDCLIAHLDAPIAEAERARVVAIVDNLNLTISALTK